MSADSVDDLHYAEDLIGRMRDALDDVDRFARQRPWTGLGDAYNFAGFEHLLAGIDLALTGVREYCRPTCEAAGDHDGECGCLCGHPE